MEPTPLEQVELDAVATNWTDVPTVLLLLGLVMVTVANADAPSRQTEMAVEIRADFFIWAFLRLEFEPDPVRSEKDIHQSDGNTLSRAGPREPAVHAGLRGYH